MGQNDVRSRLADALRDSTRGTGDWGYLIDVFGDDQSGDVIYSFNSDIRKAPYTCSAQGAVIDTANAKDVVPITTYQEETLGELKEAGARNSKRDLTMLQTIHDHASALGADCGVRESKKPANVAPVKLVESASQVVGTVALAEAARTNYPVLLITPGTGSTAHYSPALLKKAAESGTFKKGTLMFWNHATAAEEAARPEGDLNNLAAITTSEGRWDANGPRGAGIYAEAKVMADYAQKVEERAPHIGLSIRAGGTSTGRLVEGKPELKSIDYVESVDYVTKAGRGGMALAEAARDAGILENSNEGGTVDMDAAELKKLQESIAALQADNRKLKERAAVADAAQEVANYFTTVRVGEAIQERVTRRILSGKVPLTESGELDVAAINKLAESETREESNYIAKATGGRVVTGMGQASAELTEADKSAIKKRDEAASNAFAEAMGFGKDNPGAAILREGRSAYDHNFNAGLRANGVTVGAGVN